MYNYNNNFFNLIFLRYQDILELPLLMDFVKSEINWSFMDSNRESDFHVVRHKSWSHEKVQERWRGCHLILVMKEIDKHTFTFFLN